MVLPEKKVEKPGVMRSKNGNLVLPEKNGGKTWFDLKKDGKTWKNLKKGEVSENAIFIIRI